MKTNSIHTPQCEIRIHAYVIMDGHNKQFWIRMYNGKEDTKLALPQSMFMQIMDELNLKPFREQRLGLTSTITYFYNPTK